MPWNNIPTGDFGNDRAIVFGRHQQGFVIPALLLLDTTDRRGHGRE